MSLKINDGFGENMKNVRMLSVILIQYNIC